MERVENVEAHRRRRENFLVRDVKQGVNTASRRSRRLNLTARAVERLPILGVVQEGDRLASLEI